MEGVANKMSQLGRRKGRKACVQNGGESILPFLQASKLVPWMLEEDGSQWSETKDKVSLLLTTRVSYII